LYTSPTAMRGIRKEDHDGKLIKPEFIKCLEGVTLVGERCDVETFKWVQQHFKGKFVNDTYWQT
jgi:propionyl-CoA synthetase